MLALPPQGGAARLPMTGLYLLRGGAAVAPLRQREAGLYRRRPEAGSVRRRSCVGCRRVSSGRRPVGSKGRAQTRLR
jgi:hypothetical protein